MFSCVPFSKQRICTGAIAGLEASLESLLKAPVLGGMHGAVELAALRRALRCVMPTLCKMELVEVCDAYSARTNGLELARALWNGLCGCKGSKNSFLYDRCGSLGLLYAYAWLSCVSCVLSEFEIDLALLEVRPMDAASVDETLRGMIVVERDLQVPAGRAPRNLDRLSEWRAVQGNFEGTLAKANQYNDTALSGEFEPKKVYSVARQCVCDIAGYAELFTSSGRVGLWAHLPLRQLV